VDADLVMLAQEMRERSAPPDADGPDGGSEDEDGFKDRRVWLDLHFKGAGKLNGDLTPECAAAFGAMLDALGKKAGPEDIRTDSQRHHDALEEACRRLISGGLPDTAPPGEHRAGLRGRHPVGPGRPGRVPAYRAARQ
jgi:hypothetical protein